MSENLWYEMLLKFTRQSMKTPKRKTKTEKAVSAARIELWAHELTTINGDIEALYRLIERREQRREHIMLCIKTQEGEL